MRDFGKFVELVSYCYLHGRLDGRHNGKVDGKHNGRVNSRVVSRVDSRYDVRVDGRHWQGGGKTQW